MKNYEWYLFDLDNTILDFSKTAQLAFKDMVAYFKIEHIEDVYQTYNEINKKYWKQYEKGQIDSDTVKFGRFAEFSDRINIKMEAEEMSKKYAEYVLKHSFIIENTLEVINFLKPKAKLAIITNGLSHMQHDRIAKHNLANYFEYVFISDEMGVSKPDRKFFERVHTTIGSPNKDKVLVCGDNPLSDIGGANNFGYRTLFYNYHKTPDKQIDAHYKLNSWKEFF